MKTLLALPVLIAALLLSGCGTTGIGGLTPGQVIDQAKQAIQAVRDGAVVACGFLPDASVVSAILQALKRADRGSVLAGVDAVCDAITRRSGVGPPVAVVGGKKIVLKGKFVAKR